MAKETGISWCDSTFNPWIGCSEISPGCQHCYAEALMDTRWRRVKWGPGNPRQRTSPANWKQPLQWEQEYARFFQEHGHNRRVFCASLGDVFDNEAPPAWRTDLFDLIAATPHLTWLLLTKRIGNVLPMLASMGRALPLHVWLGITVVNQEEVDRDIPKLLAVPVWIRFLSLEPLLEEVSLRKYLARKCTLCNGTASVPTPGGGRACPRCYDCGQFQDPDQISWCIVGGESGPRARLIERSWIEDLRYECRAASVPFFFKQWGGVTAGAGGCELPSGEHKAWPLAA
jgi:protein gp37